MLVLYFNYSIFAYYSNKKNKRYFFNLIFIRATLRVYKSVKLYLLTTIKGLSSEKDFSSLGEKYHIDAFSS